MNIKDFYIFSTIFSCIICGIDTILLLPLCFFINLFLGYEIIGLIVYILCFILFLSDVKNVLFYFILFINPILALKVNYLFAILELKLIFDYIFIHDSNLTILLFFTKLCLVYRISTYYEIYQFTTKEEEEKNYCN